MGKHSRTRRDGRRALTEHGHQWSQLGRTAAMGNVYMAPVWCSGLGVRLQATSIIVLLL